MGQVALTGALDISVTDQSGQPVPSALVTVQRDTRIVSQGRSTPSGNVELRGLAPGAYKVLVEKQGYYTASLAKVEVPGGQTLPLEVRLQPVREYREELVVTAQPSPIDPEQSAATQAITARDIAAIPYPSTRDYRKVLPFIPGVIADNGGNIHLAGSNAQEVQDYLDGFEVSQPAGGGLGVRLNPDILRKVDTRSSRISSQFGKGSGGLADLELQDGDNRLRYNATDFLPTFQSVNGVRLNNWTPRAYVSGPMVRNRAWYDVAHEGEFDWNVTKELPEGANTNHIWRIADLARLTFNLRPGNVLTTNVLLNVLDSQHAGISPFDPYSVSFNQHSILYLITLKDQLTINKSMLLEVGAAFHRTRNSSLPQGSDPYIQTPEGREGNYYLVSRNRSQRSQAFANLYLKPWTWQGTHQITLGGEVDRIVLHGDQARDPIHFLDEDRALVRQIVFQNGPAFSLSTLESSAYIQDRWSALQRLMIEAGARWDHDSYIHRNMFSPRVAATVLLAKASETKLSAGIGVYYDRTNLTLASQAFQGARVDTTLTPALVAIPTSFQVDPNRLVMPRFVNWSIGIERRLPGRIYAQVDFLGKSGTGVWAYEPQPDGSYLLDTHKEDSFRGVLITVRRELKRGYPVVISYMRSRARSNESLLFDLDNFTTGNQLGGPLPWDAPNTVTSWGMYPLPNWWKIRKFDLAYSFNWHTGFPFPTVDQFDRLVEGPAAHRFPKFLTLNVAVERKFVFFRGYRWAARIGIDNITNSLNPAFVDNVVTSPNFLTFFGSGHRTLNGRIRFLGKPQP